jgi:hypothetical protein
MIPNDSISFQRLFSLYICFNIFYINRPFIFVIFPCYIYILFYYYFYFLELVGLCLELIFQLFGIFGFVFFGVFWLGLIWNCLDFLDWTVLDFFVFVFR